MFRYLFGYTLSNSVDDEINKLNIEKLKIEEQYKKCLKQIELLKKKKNDDFHILEEKKKLPILNLELQKQIINKNHKLKKVFRTKKKIKSDLEKAIFNIRESMNMVNE